MKMKIKKICQIMVSLAAMGLIGCATGGSDPVVDGGSNVSKKLRALSPATGPRPTVTIYEFTSSVSEVDAGAATDMFTTALVKTRRFLVLERQRLQETVMREKQMNASGMTTGNVAQNKLAGASYVFTGTISEANADQSSSGLAGSYRGVGVEKSGGTSEIAIDVRIMDANTGAVVDAVNVSKKVEDGGFSASGLGAFAQSFTDTDLQGADIGISNRKKEGIDKAVRACIEAAIYEIAVRYGGK